MTTDDLTERVARAMWMADGAEFKDLWADDLRVYEKQARAAIAVALEEAAKVADDEACHCEDTGSAPSDFGNAGRNDAARTIAADIRALIPKPTSPSGSGSSDA